MCRWITLKPLWIQINVKIQSHLKYMKLNLVNWNWGIKLAPARLERYYTHSKSFKVIQLKQNRSINGLHLYSIRSQFSGYYIFKKNDVLFWTMWGEESDISTTTGRSKNTPFSRSWRSIFFQKRSTTSLVMFLHFTLTLSFHSHYHSHFHSQFYVLFHSFNKKLKPNFFMTLISFNSLIFIIIVNYNIQTLWSVCRI
jgi:hypothetical protein